MDIRNRREIHQAAGHALTSARGNPRQVALVYGSVVCLFFLFSSILSFYLNSEIANTGGLSNMGLRSVLTTVATLLPIIQFVLVLGLQMGYNTSMLYASRGGTADIRTLSGGFRNFFPYLMANIWLGLLYTAVGFVLLYVSTMIFTFLPASKDFFAIMEPVLESMTTLDMSFTLDYETAQAASETLIPMIGIFLALTAFVIFPMTYLYRMTVFCIADGDYPSGLAALRASRQMMRGNRFQLFRLDLDFWWYYLLQALVTVIYYGDVLLALMGVALPWSATVSSFLCLIVYLALQMVLYSCFMNRVTVTYATVYEALRPKPQAKGVALGNIFDM